MAQGIYSQVCISRFLCQNVPNNVLQSRLKVREEIHKMDLLIISDHHHTLSCFELYPSAHGCIYVFLLNCYFFDIFQRFIISPTSRWNNDMWCGMRSSKMSLNSKKIKTQFSLLLYSSNSELYPHWRPNQNRAYGSRDIAILGMLKTIKYKGN